MQLHQLRPAKRKQKKVIGRGGSHGHTATRGMKGQKARSGRGGKGRVFEGNVTPLFRRTPKMRGFKSLYDKNNIVNLSTLEKEFKDGDAVDPKILVRMGIVKKEKPAVKILGSGEIKKKLIISGCLVSKSAAKKIKDAGGEVKAPLNIE
ncbi:MAG: 50S ribosomal protein L15 [Minisyncoccia bacterium]